jgi:hypothetical protein
MTRAEEILMQAIPRLVVLFCDNRGRDRRFKMLPPIRTVPFVPPYSAGTPSKRGRSLQELASLGLQLLRGSLVPVFALGSRVHQ